MFFSHAPEDSLTYVLCFWGNTANHQFRETTTKHYSEKLISFFFFVLSNWTFILAPRRLCSSSTRFSPLRSSDSASWHDDVRNICIRNIWQIHKRNNPDWLLSCKRWLNLLSSLPAHTGKPADIWTLRFFPQMQTSWFTHWFCSSSLSYFFFSSNFGQHPFSFYWFIVQYVCVMNVLMVDVEQTSI